MRRVLEAGSELQCLWVGMRLYWEAEALPAMAAGRLKLTFMHHSTMFEMVACERGMPLSEALASNVSCYRD